MPELAAQVPEGAGDPERVDGAVGTIQESGTQAMTELRRLPGLLRETGAAGPASVDGGRLAELERVVNRVRDAGVTVRTVVRGEPAARRGRAVVRGDLSRPGPIRHGVRIMKCGPSLTA